MINSIKNKKTVGITGASGALGKELTKLFRKKGYKVIGFTHSKANYEVNLESPNEWVRWECGKESKLKKHLKKLDILIFSYGQYLIDEAIKASRILNKQFSCNIINMSSINFFNLKWLKNKVDKFNKILIIDDHNIVGGLGDTLISFLTVNNLIKNKKVKKLGVTEFPKCGSKEEVLKHHKLDGLSISKVIKNF